MKTRRVSPTEFEVEGNSIQCCNSECKFTYSLRGKNRKYAERDECPRCKKAGVKNGLGRNFKLERRWHRVELDAYEANGACSCEHFSMTLEPEFRKLPKKERMTNRSRCIHIHVAREHALDEVILDHVKRHENKTTTAY